MTNVSSTEKKPKVTTRACTEAGLSGNMIRQKPQRKFSNLQDGSQNDYLPIVLLIVKLSLFQLFSPPPPPPQQIFTGSLLYADIRTGWEGREG